MLDVAAAWGIWLLPDRVVALWLAGFGGLLLLAVTPFRYATGGALRIFPIAVAVHALLSLIAIRIAAHASEQHQNPSDAVSAAGVALVASGLVALGCCWLGRSWTPKPRAEPEPPAAVDWKSSEGRRARIALLVVVVLMILFVLCVPFLGVALFLFMVLSSAAPLGWSAASLEVGQLLVAILASAVYVWLSTGKRAARRAPVPPSSALPLAALCSVLAILLPAFLSTLDPALTITHDRALFELLREAGARDFVTSFDRVQKELARRPSDRGQSATLASRELRRIAGGSSSMSARLAAGKPPPISLSPCTALLDYRSPTLSDRGPPELALIDVLFARGESEEVWAWVSDSEVPLGVRMQLVERRSLVQTFPRANLIAAFGKACVEERKRGTRAGFYLDASLGCQSAIERLLPRELSALTVEEGYAVGYAMVAIGQLSVDRYVSSGLSGDVAVAMLRGRRAAELSDASRSVASGQNAPCSSLEYLADLVCTEPHPRICPGDGFQNVRPFSVLEPCVVHLPGEPSPAQLRLGGY